MKESLNTPYVKVYKDGKLTNPIEGFYQQEHDNRRKRREYLNEPPFYGCGKNYHLTVVHGNGLMGEQKYRRRRQIITLKDGSKKTIEHYDLIS
jgi:hypothetical protein